MTFDGDLAIPSLVARSSCADDRGTDGMVLLGDLDLLHVRNEVCHCFKRDTFGR